MSANETSLTFLLKMDGGQAVSAEFQRLTAQISSQLAGLNKPNDGAAAASITAALKEQGKTAVAIQKETAGSIIVSESEKNKQIEAMWAQRQAQVSAALTKESQIVAAHAAREVQTSRETQTQIATAHQQRARQVEVIAKQGESAWAKHEAAKLSVTRQAEKQGEAIVAQTNIAKEQSNKKTETRRRQQTREALQEIARLERERLQIVTQNARAIEGLAKREADSRIREGRRAANSLLATLRDLQREEARIRAQLTQRASGSTNAFLAGAAGGLTALVGVSVISEIRQAGAAWLDYSSKLETTRIAFTTMLGSAQLANDHLKELQQFALKTPFQFGELIDASQRMQALGFNAQQVIPILNDVGNAVAAAGGGSERLDRVTLALSQIQSKGKVMTQELNQLAEAGIPAFRILQQELGKSRSEINELTKDGQISSKVFLDAFQKFSQQNFGGLMEAQSKTFSGAMSNIKDALLQTSATAFEPLFEKMTQTALRMAELSTTSTEFQKQMGVVGREAGVIWDGLVEALLAFRDAFRLMSAAVSGQITALIEGVKALAHAWAALVLEAIALARALKGDLKGGIEAERHAQDELRLATDSAKKAIIAQGEGLRTLIKIYKEAEERAKALANAQQKVGVDVGVGAGILRKARTETDDNLEKKTKGADPAATEQRLAELRLANNLARLNDEEDQLKRSLARREILFTRYEQDVSAKEDERHAAVIAGLNEEERAAQKLRKSNQQQIQLQEIQNKRQGETIRHRNETNKLVDETEANQRKQNESTTAVIRNNLETLSRIIEIREQQRIASFRALANARVKTEEEAEREILKIRLDAIDREKERLEAEVKATKSIRDPEEQLEAERKLNNDLKVLAAERTAIEQDGGRDVDAARRQDIANVRRYAEELKEIKRQVVDIERGNAEALLGLMQIHFASRKEIITTRLKLDLDSERTRHQQAEETIRNLEQENRESNRTQTEKDEQAAELNRLREAEAERHRLAMQGIRDQGRRDAQDASPFGQLQLGRDQLKEFASVIEETIIPLNQILTDSFFQVADAIGQVAANWVLLGETGPAIGRKLLAQALANLTAEATVNAIKETALGFATLFLNPAESAAHFTAAGIWASIGGVAALAGRKAAGNLFKQPSRADSASRSGGSASGQINPVTLSRNPGTPPEQRVTVRIEADGEMMKNFTVRTVQENYRSGGELRETFNNDGGV